MASRNKDPERELETIRKQLEARLRRLEVDAADASNDDARRLLHDLEVKQIELEMQNLQLRTAQAEAEESRARLADLYDFAPIVYVTLDAQGRITEANLTAAGLLSTDRGKLIGRFLASFVRADDRPVLLDHVDRCFRERVRVESEIGFDIPGRGTVIGHLVSVPFLSPDQQVIGCRTALTDITPFRRAQDKLQFLGHASAILASSFDCHATLVEVARLAVPTLADVCIVDLLEAGGQIRRLEVVSASPAGGVPRVASRLDAPRADATTALGRVLRAKQPLLIADCTPASLVTPGDGFAHDKLVRQSGARSIIVVPMVAHDVVFGAITLIAAESGRRYAGPSLSTARDLATQAAMAIDAARLYERAQGAVRAREDLLSFVSHDLRNPLMGILLTTESMLQVAPQSERRRGWAQLERIRRGAQQMRNLIEDLLDMASLDAGKLVTVAGVHEVKDLFDDAVGTLGPVAAAKPVTLAFHPPAEAVTVRCDRDRTAQVLSNLVGNAVKFTPAGGTITVAAEVSGAQALFTVTDSGPGIAADLKGRIFERFWQAEETARKGRGLGLHIAKGLVEAQGGSIWADSPPGSGTTFSFTLPLATAGEVATGHATTAVAAKRPRRSEDNLH